MGNAEDARGEANAALTIASDCDTPQLAVRALTILGFLEISLANYADALATLQPLIDAFDQHAGFGDQNPRARARRHRGDDQRRSGRRGRAADREVGDRRPSARQGVATGDRRPLPGDVVGREGRPRRGDAGPSRPPWPNTTACPMPFERARTLLLLGQLQRRQRLKQAAADTFGEALREFERMGASLWAERARDELERTKVGSPRGRPC